MNEAIRRACIARQDEARRIVLAVHPKACIEKSYQTGKTVIVLSKPTGGQYLSGYCKTEQAAWISAAKRLEEKK